VSSAECSDWTDQFSTDCTRLTKADKVDMRYADSQGPNEFLSDVVFRRQAKDGRATVSNESKR
jgi:acyl carrier protein